MLSLAGDHAKKLACPSVVSRISSTTLIFSAQNRGLGVGVLIGESKADPGVAVAVGDSSL
jgi:hypothetical protein